MKRLVKKALICIKKIKTPSKTGFILQKKINQQVKKL